MKCKLVIWKVKISVLLMLTLIANFVYAQKEECLLDVNKGSLTSLTYHQSIFGKESLKLRNKNEHIFYNLNKKVKQQEMPIQIGIDVSKIFRLDSEGNSLYGLYLYLDINLYRNILFLKPEFGKFYYNGAQSSNSFSLGMNIRAYKKNSHRIFLNIGGAIFYSESGGALALIISPKYILSFNKYFGLSTGLKYIYSGNQSIGILIGIQIF